MNDPTKQPQGTRIADIRKLQEIMHYHGLNQFKELLQAAYFNASDDTEDINKELSEKYREEANKLGDK